MALMIYNLIIFFKMEKDYLRRFYSWVDIIFIILNFYLLLKVIFGLIDPHPMNFEKYT